MKEQMNERLDALMQDERFRQQIQDAETAEDMVRILNENGVDVTASELEALSAKLTGAAGDELSEDDLELASGGVVVTTTMAIALGIGTAGTWLIYQYRKKHPKR